jgi:hypothetical protein
MGTGYPRIVCFAYDRDIEAAMADDPATVAARVAAYEMAQGWEPRDWRALGLSEGHDGYDPGPS